jgi:hypothetical protein
VPFILTHGLLGSSILVIHETGSDIFPGLVGFICIGLGHCGKVKYAGQERPLSTP